MRATTIFDVVESFVSNNIARSICIEGAPGGGKTTIVRQVANKLGIGFLELHMPTMTVEDFGIPALTPNSKEFEYKMPSWFPYAGKEGLADRGILLFDDRNQASPDLQKVLANIIQARTLHGVPMADGWFCVSTGNREKDRAGSSKVLSHLRNRETVVELDTSVDDWTKWAANNGVHPSVVSFINFRQSLLHDFEPSRSANPTPRSWAEGVSSIIGIVPPHAEHECFSGAVGEGAAAEFVGFLRIHRDLEKPEDILANPTMAKVPKDPATIYATCGSIAFIVDKKTFNNFITYIERLPAEFGVLAMRLAISRDISLTASPAFGKWGTKNGTMLA